MGFGEFQSSPNISHLLFISHRSPAVEATDKNMVIMSIINVTFFFFLQIVSRAIFFCEVIEINTIKSPKIISYCLPRHRKRKLNLEM